MLQAVRTPLPEAGCDDQLLDSLVPMWEEEKGRCGGSLPPRQGSPPRNPQSLCLAVEAVKAEIWVRLAVSLVGREWAQGPPMLSSCE
jgi:hypothetical protein